MHEDEWASDEAEIAHASNGLVAELVKLLSDARLGMGQIALVKQVVSTELRFALGAFIRRLRTTMERRALDQELTRLEWAADRCAEELAARESKPLKRVHRRLLDEADRLRQQLRQK